MSFGPSFAKLVSSGCSRTWSPVLPSQLRLPPAAEMPARRRTRALRAPCGSGHVHMLLTAAAGAVCLRPIADRVSCGYALPWRGPIPFGCRPRFHALARGRCSPGGSACWPCVSGCGPAAAPCPWSWQAPGFPAPGPQAPLQEVAVPLVYPSLVVPHGTVPFHLCSTYVALYHSLIVQLCRT